MRSAQRFPRFWISCGISTALAVLLLVSGGRYAPLPRLGCEPAPSVISGALAVASTVAAPLRHASKQRQRQAATTSHAAPGMAVSQRPRLPHPPVAFAALAPPRADLPLARHRRGMLPLSQAPPRA
ncbi:hypothetical protein [Desulfovibrio sp.]|uniref:hypothetical protein n=1 Tax=Desulfovibrio sp. TaxID=885 RepID=UPI0023CD685C|nr:hypothetical protein [Desulfovibrio sp.]MDE7240306.1 hypothetical protein [Desulfovibrio sp.]